MQHRWVASPYGHGSKACAYCKMTWEECQVIGDVNICHAAADIEPTVARLLLKDAFNQPIDPQLTYRIVYKVNPKGRYGPLVTVEDNVSGEDLIACAEWIDNYFKSRGKA